MCPDDSLLLTDVGSVEVRYQRGEGAAVTCLGVSAVLRVVRLSDGSASDSSEDEALLHPSLTLQRCISCTRLIRFTISSQSLSLLLLKPITQTSTREASVHTDTPVTENEIIDH